ncbi:hypothetical protein D9613_000662 [Agrocybe pediades]|uniref:Uncharacterized protein n=1 Tax=Agrocybe pediades TaxID=84607 RepID=A0A8H4VRV9_9AGAR|nr:hypothetical protein D9613_000662 [Agrocybe pediades]
MAAHAMESSAASASSFGSGLGLGWDNVLQSVRKLASGDGVGQGQVDWNLLSSYAGLLGLATFSIYAGANGSLPKDPVKKVMKPTETAEGEKEDEKEEEEDDDDDEDEETERMSADDAWLFPIIGSVALVLLYTIVKYLGDTWINWLLGWYFALAGVGSVWNSSISLTRYLVGETRWKSFEKVKVSVKKGAHVVFGASLRTPSIILLPLSVVPSGLYVMLGSKGRSVLLTDVLALSFAYNALSLLKIDSFKTGTILLSGLFVYDVWWVFGTDVMVKVATTLDVPIKLLWPKSVLLDSARGYTMLGLGDVVIPGTFIALALRYDHHRNGGKKGPKPYFYMSLGGYVAGMVMTMYVMDRYGQAQPALLYLR